MELEIENLTLLNLHRKLSNILHPTKFTIINEQIEEWIKSTAINKKRSINKKLNNLLQSAHKNKPSLSNLDHKFYPRTNSKTNIHLTKDLRIKELNLLKKGLKQRILQN